MRYSNSEGKQEQLLVLLVCLGSSLPRASLTFLYSSTNSLILSSAYDSPFSRDSIQRREAIFIRTLGLVISFKLSQIFPVSKGSPEVRSLFHKDIENSVRTLGIWFHVDTCNQSNFPKFRTLFDELLN